MAGPAGLRTGRAGAGARVIAIVATLDTKGEEAAFVRDWLHRRGHAPRLVDVGIRGQPACALGAADADREQVARSAGTTLGALRTLRRDRAIAAMGEGAAAILRGWLTEATLAGVIGLGGNQGTAIACTAMRALPMGLPKVMVSTVASRNLRPHIGSADITVVNSIGDLLGGPNRITRPVLVRAAAMVLGKTAAADDPALVAPPAGEPAVALTALGNTEPAAIRVMTHLRRCGYEVVPFHASGVGGSAMESLVGEGAFAAVIDLTTHELLGELFGEDIYAPLASGRLTAAGRAGLPQVVAPGGLDYFVFGPPESVPRRHTGRPTHHHNPFNTNVRASAEELHRTGQVLAQRLNEARGPAAFLYPLRGWSEIGREGGPLWDPQANEALRQAIRGTLRMDRVRYIEVDAGINDLPFVDEVVTVFLDLVRPAAFRS